MARADPGFASTPIAVPLRPIEPEEVETPSIPAIHSQATVDSHGSLSFASLECFRLSSDERFAPPPRPRGGQLASALTAMFVRYNVIGGRETTVMESTVYEAAANLRRTTDYDAAVAALAALAPDAQDFVARLQRASVSRIATARYLLREIRLGNLTLLGKRLNTAIKNADFATKKRDGYAGSDILMTQELLSIDTWDTAAIDERQRELSNWVFDIWHFPGEEAPAEHAEAPAREAPAQDVAAELEQLPEVPA
jgi:hypothetical protein